MLDCEWITLLAESAQPEDSEPVRANLCLSIYESTSNLLFCCRFSWGINNSGSLNIPFHDKIQTVLFSTHNSSSSISCLLPLPPPLPHPCWAKYNCWNDSVLHILVLLPRLCSKSYIIKLLFNFSVHLKHPLPWHASLILLTSDFMPLVWVTTSSIYISVIRSQHASFKKIIFWTTPFPCFSINTSIHSINHCWVLA